MFRNVVGMLETVTFPGVEVLRPGDWNAAKGDGLITDEDIASIVEASKDPEVDFAVVHPGHEDRRFDGDPILGRLTNLRVDARGTLLADQVDTPAKIAPILHKAWPRRSAELRRNVTTASGKTYSMVMNGLGLLGVARPAVKGLADVVSYYSEVVALAEAAPDEAERVTLTIDGVHLEDRRRELPHDPGGDMPLIDDLRAKLGLAADADDAAILAAVTKTAETATAADALLSEAQAKLTAAETKLAEATAGDTTVEVLATKLAAFEVALAERDAKLGTLTETIALAERTATLDAAIADGRLTPAQRAEWDQRLAGPSRDAFAIALSELPKRHPGVGGEVGSSNTALREGESEISDDAIAAFAARLRK